MTHPDPKTLRKPPPDAAPATGPYDSTVPKDTVPDAKEPFDPFKFQSITMPPGLRGELIEEARQRPPEAAPEHAPPPNDTPPPEGATLNDASSDDAATVRIARKLPTERLPRVVFARAQERRRRIAVIVVGFLAGFVGFAAVWSQRDKDRVVPAEQPALASPAVTTGRPAAPLTAPLPAVAAPVPSEAHSLETPSAPSTLPAPVASTSRQPTQPAPPSARPSRERSGTPREPAPSKPSASATNVPRPASSKPSGVDLLDFEGPAPKGP